MLVVRVNCIWLNMVSYIGGLSKNHNKKTFLELQVFLMKIMAEDRVPCQLGMHLQMGTFQYSIWWDCFYWKFCTGYATTQSLLKTYLETVFFCLQDSLPLTGIGFVSKLFKCLQHKKMNFLPEMANRFRRPHAKYFQNQTCGFLVFMFKGSEIRRHKQNS